MMAQKQQSGVTGWDVLGWSLVVLIFIGWGLYELVSNLLEG
jgi:hypothetical protein